MLLDVGGQDATEPFEDVGHSDEAREILDGLLVGKLKRVVCIRGEESGPSALPRTVLDPAGSSTISGAYSGVASPIYHFLCGSR